MAFEGSSTRRLWKRWTLARRSNSSIAPSSHSQHNQPHDEYTFPGHPAAKPSTFLYQPDTSSSSLHSSFSSSSSSSHTSSASSPSTSPGFLSPPPQQSRTSTDGRRSSDSRRSSITSTLFRRNRSASTSSSSSSSPNLPPQPTPPSPPRPPLPTLQFDPTPSYSPDPLPSPFHDLLPPTYHTLTEHPQKYSLLAHIPQGLSQQDVLQVFVFDDSREVGLAGSDTQMGIRVKVPDDANLRDVRACVAGGVLTVTVAKAAE